MGTGLAVVNSNLPLSPRRGGERAAEAGLGFHGWAPRPRRARGKGMARAGARGPPRARGGSSTCGARDRECVRLWGSRARGVCVVVGGGVLRRRANAPAHRLRGLRCAWDPRWPAPLLGVSPACQRTRTEDTHLYKRGVWACCHPGCPRSRRGSRPGPGHTGTPCEDPRGNRPEIFVARRVGGRGASRDSRVTA